jgi:hypothetical protein
MFKHVNGIIYKDRRIANKFAGEGNSGLRNFRFFMMILPPNYKGVLTSMQHRNWRLAAAHQTSAKGLRHLIP